MVARKRIVILSNDPEDDEFRGCIAALPCSEDKIKAMLKDGHLVEAAYVTDRRIVALDEIARQLFVAASETVANLRAIVWVNPAQGEAHRACQWIVDGAKPLANMQLGHVV